MPKVVLTYSSLAIACLAVMAVFITATSYSQLAAATLAYPFLIFFAYKVLPLKAKRPASTRPPRLGEAGVGRGWPALEKTVVKKQIQTDAQTKTQEEKRSYLGVSDSEKRTFLKLIGATGLSFFLISIFGRRFENLLFGQNAAAPSSMVSPLGGQTNTATASPTEGYKISEIDNGLVGYYGFVNKNGGWLIMKEDTSSGSFRYTKGLSNFPFNWKDRTNLRYDYFHDLSF